MRMIISLSIIISICLINCKLYLERPINHPETIEEINKSAKTWKAGYNHRFENLNIEHAKILLGTLKTPKELKLPKKEITIMKDLPENFDLRERWPQCESLHEVRDQSKCGSCWAFGAAEAMSDRICIASEGKLQIRISTENLVSCCTACGFGCDGGYPSAAWYYFQNHGIPTGGLYNDTKTCQPYEFPPCDHHVEGKYGPCGTGEYPTPKCKETCNKDYDKKFEDDLWYADRVYSIASAEEAIMTELFEHGSLEVDFTVYEDFLNYKSGVYEHVQGGFLGGHAVKMIGWGVEDGVKYWLCVNSWNEGWGDKGTFKILRGVDECGIEDDVVGGRIKIKTLFMQ
jgi:cathepsin B